MITKTALTSNAALQSLVAAVEIGGITLSLNMILLIVVGLLTVGFLVWYFFLRETE